MNKIENKIPKHLDDQTVILNNRISLCKRDFDLLCTAVDINSLLIKSIIPGESDLSPQNIEYFEKVNEHLTHLIEDYSATIYGKIC